jgi:hypothetical protein
MERRTFDSLSDSELWLACSEPAVRQIRVASQGERTRMLAELSASQRALFLFRLLYPAHRSEADFEAWMTYLLERPDYWQGAADGLRFLGETGLLTLLDETKRSLEKREPRASSGPDDRLRRLFERFQSGYAAGSERVARLIRFDPSSFVQFSA